MKYIAQLAIAVLLAFTQLSAQTTATGAVTGKVTDAAGRGISDAAIRLESGGATAGTARTGADGGFTIDNVPAGTYSVVIEAKDQTWRNPTTVTVSGSSPIQLTLSQDRGPDTVTLVTLQAESPTIQTESTEVSRAYDTRTVRSLPLADRQNQDLISLMPGVTPPVVSQDRIADPQRRRSFNVNGLPEWASAYHQDGSYQTEMFTGKPSRVAPNAAVQQLDIVTSNFNGEHGFAGGSWINTVTRPGTGGFHGSAFGLNTSRFFATRSPLNNTGENPGFNLNQFGASVGGPIVKDKVFLFGSYEGLMRRGDEFQLATVPTSALRAGDFSAFPDVRLYNPSTGGTSGAQRLPFAGNRIPTASFSPLSRALLGYLPEANQPGLANNLAGNARLLEDLHRFDFKLDHRLSEKSTGFLRYGFTHSSVDRGSILGVLGDAAQAQLRNHNAVASWTHSFSNSVAGEFRGGYSRYRNAISAWGDSTALDQSLAGFNFSDGLPQLTVSGFGSYGLPGNYPSRAINNTYDLATNWNWHTGMHHLKLGVQAIHYRIAGFDAGAFSPRGTFAFGPGATSLAGGDASFMNPAANGFAAFLLGAPTTAGVSSFLQTPTYQQTLTSAYATDTINLWSKLYLELGVRYDVYSPLATRSGAGTVVFDPASNRAALSNNGAPGLFGEGDYDLNNVAPRVGLAFRPVSRVALRAGYGMHYFPEPISAAAINQAALAVQMGLAGGFGVTPFAPVMAPTGISGSTASNQPFYASQSGKRQTPYVQTYSAMIQADAGNGFLVDVGYVGNTGRHLPYSRALNIAMPGSGTAGLPGNPFNRTAQTTLRGNGLNSNFNSLQVNMTKRFAAGLALAAAYTYGKALDYGFEQSNPYDSAANYGPADWDRKHILAISHLWQLPFGAGSPHMNRGWAGWLLGSWELNGILRWASGTPYAVTADALACACPGLVSQPANFSGSASALNGQATFDPRLFSQPQAGSFGTQGRNSFRGPELFQYDLSMFRSFPIRESFKFELRGEVYNLTNTANYMNPSAGLGSPAFGRSTAMFNGVGGRQFQLGGRLLF